MRQIHYNEPTVLIHDNGNIEVFDDFTITYGQWKIELPTGFISDGNSVPWLFRWLVPKFGKNTIAGIVHDWLYYRGDILVDNLPQKITRRQADIVRLDLCRKCSVPFVQRAASYIGLRLGGFFAWRSHRKREKESGEK